MRLADASEEVPDLSKGREYSSFLLTRRDWENLDLLREVIQVRYSVLFVLIMR